MSRKLWGKAKLEVLALRSEILALAMDGLTVNQTYKQLADRLSVGERTFRRHASYIIKDTRTLTLKRLLNENVITPKEFETRINARLNSLASPSSEPPKNKREPVLSPTAIAPPSPDPQHSAAAAADKPARRVSTIITPTNFETPSFAEGLRESNDVSKLFKRADTASPKHTKGSDE